MSVRYWFVYILLSLLPITASTQTSIKSFYFENNESVPTPYSQNQLKILKTSFQRGEIYILEIYAYTDSVGSTEYNDSLAKKRLAYVTNFMGITNSTDVRLKPYGLVRKYDVKDYKNWRRVDIYYSTHPISKPDTTSNDKIAENVAAVPDTNVTSEKESVVKQPITEENNGMSLTDSLDQYTNGDLAYILNIEFIEGTAKMDVKSEAEVKEFAQFLKDHPNLSILIRGHVCCGNNMRISKARARAVYHELIKQGIDKDRLDYVGMSNNEPLVFPEKTNADRQRNRRVDVKFKVIDL